MLAEAVIVECCLRFKGHESTAGLLAALCGILLVRGRARLTGGKNETE